MIAALLLSLLYASAQAQAQTPANELEARTLFEGGQQAFAEQRYDDARRLFERSLELHPTEAAAFNAAQAAEESGDLVAAIAHLDALLADRYGALSQERASATRAARARLLARVGTLVVHSDRAGVEVSLDGEPMTLEGGEATAHVAPGEHGLVVAIPGCAPRERTVQIAAGERRTIDLVLDESLAGERPAAPPSPTTTGTTFDDDSNAPLIIGIAAAVALAIGTAIVLAVTVGDSDDPPGNIIGTAETLRVAF